MDSPDLPVAGDQLIRCRGAVPRLLLAAAALAAAAAAQPVKQERRTVARHDQLLQRLWAAARQRPEAELAKLDAALLAEQRGDPFRPLALAWAALRGVAADAAFLTRFSIHATALPEIVDPTHFEDGNPTLPFRLHVTMHTPVVVAGDQELWFGLSLVGSSGFAAWSGVIAEVAVGDLAYFEARTAVPVLQLDDGAYDLRVHTRSDGSDSRPTDVEPDARVHVLRGFVARARQVVARADELAAAAEPLAAGLVRGAVWPVQRVFVGEPQEGGFDPVADLAAAEAVVANVAAGRRPWHGLAGWLHAALAPTDDQGPTKTRGAHLRVRVPPADPSGQRPRLPLVLFMPGAPTWDGASSRPAFTAKTPPDWLASALVTAGFDAAGRYVLAVVESPGEQRRPDVVVRGAVAALAAAGIVDPERVVLVGEREAAHAMAIAAVDDAMRPPRGLVLAVGAGLDPGHLDALADTAVLAVFGQGHGSAANQQRLVAAAAARVAVVEPRRAWPWALLHALPRIEVFCAEALDR